VEIELCPEKTDDEKVNEQEQVREWSENLLVRR
jgi:hypothetical protein